MDKESTKHSPQPRSGKVAVGHPVDVASGVLFHQFEDYTLPGRFPISFKRRYSTGLLDATTTGMFGRGWSSPYDVKLYRSDTEIRYLDESGESEFVFTLPDSGKLEGKAILDAGSFADLTATDTEYCVTRWDPDDGSITRDYFPRNSQSEPLSIARREDDQSNAIEFVYSSNTGLLTYIVQKREQRGLQLVYDNFNRVVEVRRRSKQKSGQTQSHIESTWLAYHYNSAGMLDMFTDALGNQASYRYDAAGRMVSETTLAGKEWRFMFDAQGRCVVTTGKNKFDYHKLDYGNSKARITKVADSYGNVTQYHHNEAGQVLKKVSPLGHAASTIFDPMGRIIQKISPEGRTTTYEYDEAGNRCSIETADGAKVVYQFNERHQAISMVDPGGFCWEKNYDSYGRVTTQTNPTGATQVYEYANNGDLIKHANEARGSREFTWDRQGNLTAASDWMGNHSSYHWDTFGNVTQATDPSGAVTTFKHDRLGRLIEATLADGHSRTYRWDVFDNLTHYTDERQMSTRWQYCDCGNLETEERADGSMLSYAWNAIPGQLAALTNQKNEVTHFDYDSDGRLTEKTDFSGSITRYEYDADGQLIKTIKPSGKEVLHEHDAVGRVVRTTYSSGHQTSYTFDTRGLLLKADNGQCPVSFEYDRLGRVVHETQGKHLLWHDYDELGNRVERRSNREDVTRFSWNANRQISAIEAQGHSPVSYDYDSRGFEKTRMMDALHLSTTVDKRGRVSRQALNASGKRLVERQYDYDAASNLITKTDNQWGSTHYAYDQLEHIVKTLHPQNVTERFDYDPAGNISSYALSNPAEPQRDKDDGWLYEKGSRIKEIGDKRYVYDADGQLLERHAPEGESTYVWNDAGQLVSFIKDSGETWHYRYDALGRRVAKEGPAEKHEFAWDGDVVLYQSKITDNNDEVLEGWEYHPHDFSPLYKLAEEKQYLCINDQIGTPMELVSADGSICWSRQGLTFGDQHTTGVNSTTCDIRFQGQWYDGESALCYNRFRYYSSETGAYISDDPIGLAGGVNPRAYSVNPAGWVDVYGLTQESCSISGVSLHRGMREGTDGPETGPTARTLGARPDTDIPVDSNGNVHPNTGGMSVAPHTPSNLPRHRRPPEHGGTGKDPVWASNSNDLGPDLVYVQDSPTHGTIQPSRSMTLQQYQDALSSTNWSKQ